MACEKADDIHWAASEGSALILDYLRKYSIPSLGLKPTMGYKEANRASTPQESRSIIHHDFVFVTNESLMDSRPYSAIDISTNLHNKVTKSMFSLGSYGVHIDVDKPQLMRWKLYEDYTKKRKLSVE